jgi:hypothetical protein
MKRINLFVRCCTIFGLGLIIAVGCGLTNYDLGNALPAPIVRFLPFNSLPFNSLLLKWCFLDQVPQLGWGQPEAIADGVHYSPNIWAGRSTMKVCQGHHSQQRPVQISLVPYPQRLSAGEIRYCVAIPIES